MDIDNLIERLMNLTYRDRGDAFNFNVISVLHKDLVFNEIRKWADEEKAKAESETLDNCILLAELEAKVFTYESIIKNSNFAPILESRKGS